ncbi:MAG: mechanosensitive ion channel [Kiritimatiellae bacterium]|nr:mechanosensitive ion channel [Kiritimatiellia bacterium]
MTKHKAMTVTVRGLASLLLVLALGLPAAYAQEADTSEINPGIEKPAESSRGVLATGRQSVQALGEATSEIGGSFRTGGKRAAGQGRKLWQDVMLPAAQRMAAALPGVLKAVVLLLAFWLVGKLAGACVKKLLSLTSIDERAARDWGLDSLLKKAGGGTRSLAGMAGGAIKWFFILFGFVAFFNALNLAMVAGPLQNVLDRIVGAVPSLIKAAAILFLYWVIAALVRAAVTRTLGAMKFDSRFGKHIAMPQGEGTAVPPSVMIGKLLFYVILLFGVPPFLQALGQQALVYPLQEMLSKTLGFLPNLFAAAIILVVGRIVATIVREVVCNFLAASGADAGAEKLGLGKVFGANKLSNIASKIAYFFIFIPILVQAVDSLAIKAISDPIKATLQTILAAIPSLMVAVIIIIIGCVVAKVVRSMLESFLSGVGLDSLPKRLGLAFLETKEGQLPPSGLIAAAVAAVIMLITAQQASASLGFDQLAELIRRVVEYLPNLVVGLVILLAALSLGNYAGSLVSRSLSSHANAGMLSIVARYAVILLGVSMALEQLGVGKEIVMLALGALLGGSAIALGLAFGLGGKDRARELIENWSRGKG